jgi:redox-sensitive bicupin YhaK (pirin superfamily)
VIEPGHLAYFGTDRDEIALDATDAADALLLGGVPFPEPVLMWWNFVARERDEIDAAYDAWHRDDGRFGGVDSPLARIPAPPPTWS